MTAINGVIGGIGAAFILAAAIFSLAAKKRDAEEVDTAQIHAIENGLETDAEWVEEIRDGAFKGLVSPSVARAACSACDFSDEDLVGIEKSYKSGAAVKTAASIRAVRIGCWESALSAASPPVPSPALDRALLRLLGRHTHQYLHQ